MKYHSTFFLFLPKLYNHAIKKTRSIIKYGAWGAVLTTAISCSPSQQIKTEREDLPNIILIHLDDMGYGLDKNTLVIFTSDNGPWINYGNHAGSTGSLREGKGTTFKQSVMAIGSWYSLIREERMKDSNMESMACREK